MVSIGLSFVSLALLRGSCPVESVEDRIEQHCLNSRSYCLALSWNRGESEVMNSKMQCNGYMSCGNI